MGCSQGGMALDKEVFSMAEFQLVVSPGVSIRMAGWNKDKGQLVTDGSSNMSPQYYKSHPLR